MVLRSGTWTILFTDVVGSTEQRVRIGDARAEELRRDHDQIVSVASARFAGVIVKGTGDGAMIALASAADALAAAVLIQQLVERRNRHASEPIAVRIGLALGDVHHENDDLFGTPVVEASRICALAGSGEILASDVVRAVAGSRAPCEMVRHGEHELKGLREPVTVWDARWSAVPADAEVLGMPSLLEFEHHLPFAGRDSELASLSSTLKSALAGDRRVTLVSGEPGVGKTRLAAELAREAHAAGAVVLYGRCDEAVPLPYQPFVEALDWYVARARDPVFGSHATQLARISAALPARVGDEPDIATADGEQDQYRVFVAVSSWIGALAATTPVVFVLDDLHWASRPTLLMLRHVLRELVHVPLFIIATYRDTDLGRAHPLGSMLTELRAFPGVERLPLEGLDERGTLELLGRTATQTVDDEMTTFARAIRVETEGNPLFIGEILRHLTERGALQQRDGRWITTEPLDSLEIPEGVKDVIGQRLARLGDTSIAVFQVAALAGRDFRFDVVAAAAPQPGEAVLDVLDRALETRLVEETGRDQYRFTHALVCNALIDEMSSARRMHTHGLIARALEELRPTDLAALAFHWCEAAGADATPKAIDFSLRAAEAAVHQAAFDEAVSLLERACDVAANANPDASVRATLLIALGDARMACGAVDEARAAYLDAANLVDDDSPELSRIALSWHGLARVAALDHRGEPILRRALSGIDEEDDPATAARLHAHLALTDHDGSVGQRERDGAWTPRQLSEAETAVRLAERSGDAYARFDAYCSRFWTIRPTDAPWEHAARALDAAREIDTPVVMLEALVYAMLGEGQRGNQAAFRALAREHWQLAETSGLRIPRGFSRGIAARLHMMDGDIDGAEQLANEATAISNDQAITLFWVAVHLRGLSLRDRNEEAVADIRSWIDADLIPTSARMLLDAAVALFLAYAGERAEASALVADLCRDNLARVAPLGDVFRLGELARLADACAMVEDQEHAATLREALLPWEGQNVQLSLAEDCGPTAFFLGRLERVLGRLDDAIPHLEHALELTARGENLRHACEARIELGAALRQRGHHDRAASLLADARDFASSRGIALLVRRIDEMS